ncbi:MAG: tetratricopeptide repeat protein [Bythopirellula sp.]|nr:tetratricopeptide repeat protein [Bythopirellula sp.]
MSHDYSHRPLLAYHYERYLVDQNIGAYIRSISSSYTVGGLERVAASCDPASRRGAVLALGRLADYRSNTVLGKALVDKDRGVRTLAESAIQQIWLRIGTTTHQRHLVAIGEQLDERDFERAAQLATALLDETPWLAQAWYYRGKAFFQLGQYEAASRDCHQALEVNSFHFLAASMMGQAYLQMNDPISALDSFRRALRLNPNMEEVRAQVIHLQRRLKDKS